MGTLKTGAKTGAKIGAKKFPTDCYGEINKYKWRPSGFMKKINGGLYRVTRFACDKYRNLNGKNYLRLYKTSCSLFQKKGLTKLFFQK